MLDVLSELVLQHREGAAKAGAFVEMDEAYVDSVVRDLLADLDLDLNWTPPNPGITFA